MKSYCLQFRQTCGCSPAFTLIELLIVVAIIAILAAIAIPNFLEAQVRAKVAAVRSDQRNMAMALEAYNVDNDSYPAKVEWIRPGPSKAKAGLTFETIGISGLPFVPDHPVSPLTTPVAYMTDLPIDPFQAGQKIEEQYEIGWYWYYFWEGGRIPGAWGLLFPPTYWMLVSMAPDKIFHAAHYGPILEFHWAAHYDSSNGTISAGDIARIGP